MHQGSRPTWMSHPSNKQQVVRVPEPISHLDESYTKEPPGAPRVQTYPHESST